MRGKLTEAQGQALYRLSQQWRAKEGLGTPLTVLKMLLAYGLVERDMTPGPERESHLWKLTDKGLAQRDTLQG